MGCHGSDDRGEGSLRRGCGKRAPHSPRLALHTLSESVLAQMRRSLTRSCSSCSQARSLVGGSSYCHAVSSSEGVAPGGAGAIGRAPTRLRRYIALQSVSFPLIKLWTEWQVP